MKADLVACVRLLHDKGHSPGTSTNYSYKVAPNEIWVSRSGIDKSNITEEDFLSVNEFGEPNNLLNLVRPSAETLIHCILYNLFPDTMVVLHSHAVYPIALTANSKGKQLTFSGYEMQKGFFGTSTHEGNIHIPVLENSQEMEYFKQELTYRMPELTHGVFMIRKHGFYAWGPTLFQAKRHLESFDYLCQCEYLISNK